MTTACRMLVTVLLVLGFAVSGAAGAAGATGAPAVGHDDDVGDLQERIDALVAEHLGETTPGAMVAVVGPEGPLLTEAWGWADPVSETPLTVDSRTPVASISKVVTGLTALQLHHEGLLDLDADIRAELPVQDRRAEVLREPVTGRHLLTHHGGITEALLLHPDPEAEDTESLLPPLQDHPPVLSRPSGIGLHYSPTKGHALIGAAIEEATGTSFDAAAAQWVLDPIGAQHADFAESEADVQLSTRDGDGWRHTSWPEFGERPAASLTWSARDASALLQSLISGNGLAEEVISEATTAQVRPAHGGGGHTQVFFESWRSGVPVLEHAGANGLAWLAIMPDAQVGVFAAVTTEDPGAGELTSAVLDEVAQWAVDTGLTDPDPMPIGGMPQITPSWAQQGQPAAPVGTFSEQLFTDRGPELLLRSLTGQITVSADGDDLVMGDRRLTPVATPGRWCDDQGCLAGVRAADGTVLLLRSDQAMLQETLVPAPWWADLRFVIAAVAGVGVLTALSVGGALRSRWRHRREQVAPQAVSRRVALIWSIASVALIAGTVALPLYSLTRDATAYLDGNGAAVWALRLGTAVQLGLGGLWLVMLVRRWSALSRWRRVLAPLAALVGLAMSIVLVTWALPAV